MKFRYEDDRIEYEDRLYHERRESHPTTRVVCHNEWRPTTTDCKTINRAEHDDIIRRCVFDAFAHAPLLSEGCLHDREHPGLTCDEYGERITR